MKMSDRRNVLVRTIGLALAIGIFSESTSAFAAELIVFSSKDCVVTQKFKREVAAEYRKTKGSQTFPLRLVNIGDGPVDVILAEPVTMSPTFVFVDKNKEIARITGYPGREIFLRLTEGAADAFVKE
jgi:thioredoxin-related protein